MGKGTLGGLWAVVLAVGTQCSVAAETELIANGGFESGDFSGWSILSTRPAPDGWFLNDGTFLPAGPAQFSPPLAPISGGRDAVTNQTGPGTQRLVSDTVDVPNGVLQATLSFSDRLRNWSGFYMAGVQEFRVELVDANLIPIAEIFATAEGDASQQLGPNQRTFDVTPILQVLEGEQVRVAFVVHAEAFFFNVSVDDVSLRIVQESSTPTILTAAIDVRPGSDENPINLAGSVRSRGKARAAGGVLPVAILSAGDFDAIDVDDDSIVLGDPSLEGAAWPLHTAVDDVDGDGRVDLICHFSIRQLVDAGAIDFGTASLLLSGTLHDGTPFSGSDDVQIAPRSR